MGSFRGDGGGFLWLVVERSHLRRKTRKRSRGRREEMKNSILFLLEEEG